MHLTEGDGTRHTAGIRIVRSGNGDGRAAVQLIDGFGMTWDVSDFLERNRERADDAPENGLLGNGVARYRAFIREDKMTKLFKLISADDHDTSDSALTAQFRGAEFLGRTSWDVTSD